MEVSALHFDESWPYVETLLPRDLEESARRNGAIRRRRNIRSASDFIRIILAYAVSDLGMRDTAAWASAQAIAQLSGPGLFQRLALADKWLEEVLAQVLADEAPHGPSGARLRVVDATAITGPGATTTSWRAHMVSDPATGKFTSVELTDVHGGESLVRHEFHPGEVVLADRAYATPRGIEAVDLAGAKLVVRLYSRNLRLYDQQSHPLRLMDRLEEVPALGAVEWDVLVPLPPTKATSKGHGSWKKPRGVIPARVVAARTSKGEVVHVLTTLEKELVTAEEVLTLYRLRWQVELLFKRLKSLLHLDALPSEHGPTARTWLLARLLAAALAQKLVDPQSRFSPWGYDFPQARHALRLVEVPDGPVGPAEPCHGHGRLQNPPRQPAPGQA